MLEFGRCLQDMAQQEFSPRGDPQRNLFGTEFDFGGVRERVVTRDDFPLKQARQVLKDETIAVLGYGVQGPAQALNLKDNGFNVIVGQRQGPSFVRAVEDGWEPGRNLFSSIEEAVKRGTQIQYLLSDAGQREVWPQIAALLKPGDALYFSHGFSYVFRNLTGVVPPPLVDVILVAPKGAGRSVRQHFLEGRGINSSFAIAQDATGRARERVLATGMAIGSGFLFPTTFENEVYSDLTGERGVLMGAVWGLCQAAYNNLRERGCWSLEAAAHTIEITTQTIARIIGEKGADGLVADIPPHLSDSFASAFRIVYDASGPVFEDLYQRVVNGIETQRVLEANSNPDYRNILNSELKGIAESEIGRASTDLRQRRPAVPFRIENNFDAIMAGALVGLFHAQYDLFRKKGHLPSEAFNETVEEATQSLYPLIGQRGMDWMFANCSTTAQRGALDWNGKFRVALQEPLRIIYGGTLFSTQDVNTYIRNSEMWKAGKQVRALRPESKRLT